MAVMLALGMPVTYDKKGTIKLHKPQIGTTPTTDFLGEITQQINHQICTNDMTSEIATDISTCGDDGQVR